jgi:hypothetical protein
MRHGVGMGGNSRRGEGRDHARPCGPELAPHCRR